MKHFNSLHLSNKQSQVKPQTIKALLNYSKSIKIVELNAKKVLINQN